MRWQGIVPWLLMAQLGFAMPRTQQVWYRSKTIPANGSLAREIRKGNIRAATQLITELENKSPSGLSEFAKLFRYTGNAHIVGFTGPPGAGKSTLVAEVALELRARGLRVGILMVDPTSPISGGALLGDRARMPKLSRDDGIVIRSIASRMTHGGLSRDTMLHAAVLDALGADVILIESVGAGQDDVVISGTVHTTVVVHVPNAGDGIQANKAGINEGGDIHVVNKGDLEGADTQVMNLKEYVSKRQDAAGRPYEVPVLKTTAVGSKRGIRELADAVMNEHHQLFSSNGGLRARLDITNRNVFRHIAGDRVVNLFDDLIQSNGSLDAVVKKITERKIDPLTAVDELLKKVKLLDLTGRASITKSHED